MSQISICLWFDTEAEEAANHYIRIFKEMGREASARGVGRYNAHEPGPAGKVMTATFTLDGQDFMALNGGPHFKQSPAMSIMVKCADQAELDGFWDKLVDGGRPSQCGWLDDKFGVSWHIVPKTFDKIMGAGDPDAEARLMRAMMPMVKLDIATLEHAAAG
jgi:predicted 3-demethylubiquinone-9 3-methyltransferase (glyoxalase superfamily)